MIHVAFFQRKPNNFCPNTGGVQRIVRLIEKELLSRGIRVSLISGSPSSDPVEKIIYLPSEIIDSKVNIQYLQKVIERDKITHLINEDALDNGVYLLLKNLPDRIRLISVHNNCIKCLEEQYENIFRANRSRFFALLIDLTGSWSIVRYLFRTKMKRHWSKLMESSDAVVVYFEQFRNELKELIPIQESKVFAIANPNPFVKIQREAVSKRIVYVGRIEENQKRIDKLMLLWKELHENLDDWQFDLVGDGSYMPQVKKYIAENNLNRIEIHGWQDPLNFWDEADIFTLTSDFEGYGMVIVEAQARGVIPVSFKCYSAIEDVIENGISGVLIDDFDLNEMKDSVIQLARNENDILNYRLNLDSKLENFSIDRIADQWVELFNRKL